MYVSTVGTTQLAVTVGCARRDSTGSLARVSTHLMCAHLVDVRGLGCSLGSWIVSRLVQLLSRVGKVRAHCFHTLIERFYSRCSLLSLIVQSILHDIMYMYRYREK